MIKSLSNQKWGPTLLTAVLLSSTAFAQPDSRDVERAESRYHDSLIDLKRMNERLTELNYELKQKEDLIPVESRALHRLESRVDSIQSQMNQFNRDIERNRRKISVARAAKERLEAKKPQLESTVAQKKNAIQNLKSKRAPIADKFQKEKIKVAEMRNEFGYSAGKVKNLKREVDQLQSEFDQKSEALANAQSERKRLTRERTRYMREGRDQPDFQKKFNAFAKKISNAIKKAQSLEKEIRQIEPTLKRKKKQLASLERIHGVDIHALETAEAELKTMKNQLEKINQKLTNAKAAKKNAEDELANIETKISGKQNQIRDLKDRNRVYRDKVVSLQSEMSSLHYEISHKQDQVRDLRNSLERLRDREIELGYQMSDSQRFADEALRSMKESRHLSGQIPNTQGLVLDRVEIDSYYSSNELRVTVYNSGSNTTSYYHKLWVRGLDKTVRVLKMVQELDHIYPGEARTYIFEIDTEHSYGDSQVRVEILDGEKSIVEKEVTVLL